MSWKPRLAIVLTAAALGLLTVAPTYAVLVGWNVDIHQGKWNGQYWPPGVPPPVPPPSPPWPFPRFANDFHVWGVVESMLTPPILLNQVNFQTTGPFTVPPFQRIAGGLEFPAALFTAMFSQMPPFPWPLPPGPPPMPPIIPGGPFYYFAANWKGANIPFCSWMHFGLLFRVNGCNYGYWLRGMWTYNGIDPPGPPIYGFEVGGGIDPTGGGTTAPQYIRIGNTSGRETYPMSMDLMVMDADEGRAFPLEDLNTDFFTRHTEYNQRWVHMPAAMLPQYLPSSETMSSFFDVFFEQLPTPGGPLHVRPGQILIARQHSGYFDTLTGSDGAPTIGTADFWQYEIHGQVLPGDITDDGHVDVVDLLWFVDAFGTCQGDPAYDPLADFNADGCVDVVDLLWLVQFFGW
jgi:hypothetical protein